jgi:hypothetical protein
MYAIGAYFCDHYAELVDEALADADAIERVGLRAWARAEGISDADACEALVTGLSIRFYAALADDVRGPAAGRGPVPTAGES